MGCERQPAELHGRTGESCATRSWRDASRGRAAVPLVGCYGKQSWWLHGGGRSIGEGGRKARCKGL